jgi:hypothetical protein
MNKKGLSKNGHIIFSIFLFLIIFFIVEKNFNLKLDWIIYVSPFLLGGIMPDVLEFPSSPFHRGLIHSKKFGYFLLGAIIIVLILCIKVSLLYIHLISFLIGMVGHLAIDSFSHRGLV